MYGYTLDVKATQDIVRKDILEPYEEFIIENVAKIDDAGYFSYDEETFLDVLAEAVTLVRNQYQADAWKFNGADGSERIFIVVDNEDNDDLYISAEVEVGLLMRLIKLLPEIGQKLGVLGEGIVVG